MISQLDVCKSEEIQQRKACIIRILFPQGHKWFDYVNEKFQWQSENNYSVAISVFITRCFLEIILDNQKMYKSSICASFDISKNHLDSYLQNRLSYTDNNSLQRKEVYLHCLTNNYCLKANLIRFINIYFYGCDDL